MVRTTSINTIVYIKQDYAHFLKKIVQLHRCKDEVMKFEFNEVQNYEFVVDLWKLYLHRSLQNSL